MEAVFGRALGMAILVGLMLGGLIVGMLLLAPIAAEKRAICDRVVERLLAADTMVELERSKYLLDNLDCLVSRRLREALRR
jgi:hypothetical protein